MSYFDDLTSTPAGSRESRQRAVEEFSDGDAGALLRWSNQLEREMEAVAKKRRDREERIMRWIGIVLILAAGALAFWKMLP